MTNWAYGITVCLTITSGIAMLMASNAEKVNARPFNRCNNSIA